MNRDKTTAEDARLEQQLDQRQLDAEQIRLGIDACRPGSRDLQSPELKEVAEHLRSDRAAREAYHRLQQFDARVAEAFHDVSVPADLGQRILARLQAATPMGSTSVDAASVEPTPPVELPPAQVDLTSRRRWIASVAAVAASLLVVGALTGYLPFGGDASSSEPAMIVEGWYSSLGEKWQPVAAAPSRFSAFKGVAATARGCQLIERDVWAFKLSAPGSRKAMLFVAKMSLPGLPAMPPIKPQSSTGGRSLGVWQSRGLVYFLVVEGDDQLYRTFVNSSSSPLA